jgi:transketolase N-terminal domain/subunit
MGATRSPAEIRRSIEANRAELGQAVERLRTEVSLVTDWRRQLQTHKKQVIVGAAVAGFVLGGGIAAATGILTGRRRRRQPWER